MPNDYPIPQTGALRQVQRQSLQELFNRNPEQYSKGDMDDIILSLRDLRDRLATTDGGRVRQVRVATPPPKGAGNPEDLGL